MYARSGRGAAYLDKSQPLRRVLEGKRSSASAPGTPPACARPRAERHSFRSTRRSGGAQAAAYQGKGTSLCRPPCRRAAARAGLTCSTV
eukprot:15327448-Ditylum_brightwellii.AAC.1